MEIRIFTKTNSKTIKLLLEFELESEVNSMDFHPQRREWASLDNAQEIWDENPSLLFLRLSRALIYLDDEELLDLCGEDLPIPFFWAIKAKKWDLKFGESEIEESISQDPLFVGVIKKIFAVVLHNLI